ncbi:MAG: hypothetical protein ABSC61_11755 [Anaerolineales bacterium]
MRRPWTLSLVGLLWLMTLISLAACRPEQQPSAESPLFAEDVLPGRWTDLPPENRSSP